MKYFFLTILLVGCGKMTPGVTTSNATVEQAEQIQRAFQYLKKPVDIQVTVYITTFKEKNKAGQAPFNTDNCDIQIDRSVFLRSGDYVSRTVLHEYGHCKGLHHSEKECSIMYFELCDATISEELLLEYETF